MRHDLTFVWDERLRAYDFGPDHPMSPIRVFLAHKLICDWELLDLPYVDVVGPVEPASEVDLLRVHRRSFVEAVQRASLEGAEPDLARGLGTEDVPIFIGMHDAAALVAGATLAAARAVHAGATRHAINLTGGLHHAMPGAAAGFCIYNDIAVAIAWLLEQGVSRIAYVDVDVHHGDGVQAIFYDDPRVMTISLHEDPQTLFPGTGYPDEIGGPNARGTAVNVALPAGTTDTGWLRAFDAVVPEVLKTFQPEILFTQHGCDTHADDPLAHLSLSIEGQLASYQRLHSLAHQLCGGQWIAVGGGGYECVDVVPRAWTHLTAVAAEFPIDPQAPVPSEFTQFLQSHLGRPGPLRMGDGVSPHPQPWGADYDMLDPVDRCVLTTRDAVFPSLGLVADPLAF